MQPNTRPGVSFGGRASGSAASNGSPRPSTNNDANAKLLSQSLKRMSLHTAAANTPLPQSPALHSHRLPSDAHRIPSSPGFAPYRSSSRASLSRSSSPAPSLRKKSSTASLRGDMPSSPRPSASRRSSFIPNMPSPGLVKPSSPLVPQMEEKPPLRACDIAEEYFKKELALHDGMAGAVSAGTIVIIHDQCYGHRYARPKTTKSTLNTIMERPERMLASVRGVSAAYVRLGERHAEGNNAPQPNHSPSERIPFKIRKTSRAVDLTSAVVTNVHGTKWMEEFKTLCETAEQKLASTGKELARDAPTIPGQPSKTAFHPMDLYLCSESLSAIQGALGGVLDAVDAVFTGSELDNGVSRAFVCIRPPGHHCSSDWPSGFCWINNVHVGIEHAMANYGLTHAAIIDFDLHHGDGSQDITWERNKKVNAMRKNTPNWKKTSIGYFSLHDINSFPCEEGDDEKVRAASLCVENAHGQSVWNVHLETWSTPEEFWQIYEDKYLILLEKTRKYLKFHTDRLRKSPNHPAPKAAIFISAGFDASEHETSGMQRHTVNVPTEFYARFTRDVVRLAEEADTGVNGRIISVLEGGYSDRALSSGVLSHLSGLCDGQVWTEQSKPSKGLAFNLQQQMSNLSMYDGDASVSSTPPEPILLEYDPKWWHISRLEELENLVTPPAYVAPKKVRTGPAAHFSSPTQSFTAKVVDPTKVNRSLSGRFHSASPSRAPTPPPPEVDWATATHALSRLLIPSDRQTRSFMAEDLAEPKVKKEKPAPTLNSVHVDPSGRQLRGRKPVTSYVEPRSDDETSSVRNESRSSRRQTIADFPLATTETTESKRTPSRRMSIASSVSSIAPERSVSRASSIVPPGRRSATPGLAASGVPVKKARGTTTAASRMPRNPPPVPSMPTQYQVSKDQEKEKENDIDQLTSDLKRVTLKLAPRAEHDAREKEKAAEKKPRAAARKPAVPRAPKTATTKAPAPKKPAGRPPKASKLPSPVEPTAVVTSPQLPQSQATAAAPLEEPKPVTVEPTAKIIEQIAASASTPGAQSNPVSAAEPGRRQSSTIVEPPTDLVDMTISPEQLPKSAFITSEPVVLPTSPPRPDTPPPPPPAVIPEFTSYNTPPFGTTQLTSSPPAQTGIPASLTAPLQWAASNANANSGTTAPPTTMAAPISASSPMSSVRPMSAAGKRGDLPVFSANGVIPFASNITGGASTGNSALAPEPKVKEEEKTKYGDIWEVPDTPAR
ncbi:Arginase/deacetylase [Byssothecium circinans]|uniref:Arginase/deacetylase n=1 Tax=Byssothecium circinans TaxID=147558 RepID=A0A6A5U794_9PLEO|nr:Arginase/deacetylase [Byssothecium circinans]